MSISGDVEDETELSNMDGHQADSGQSYITVIPVEYPRHMYSQPQKFTDDQYREYLRERAREEYIRGDYNKNSGPHFDDLGHLYTMLHRMEQKQTFDCDSHESHETFNGDSFERERRYHPHIANSDTNPRLSDTVPQQQQKQQQQKEDTSWQQTQKNTKPLGRRKMEVCVFLMSRVALKVELEDGPQTTVQELNQVIVEEEELGLSKVAVDVFTLWMISIQLELQLKSRHRPLMVRREWPSFLARYTQMPESSRIKDEPVLSYQRNVFFPKRDEVKLRDSKVLEFLYEEAKFNILEGRYPCEVSDYIMLAGLQARLELGPYNPMEHTPEYIRSKLKRFLPHHCMKPGWSIFSIGSKTSPEARLIEQYKKIPSNASAKKLVKKYLEFCWSLPYYGSAFFYGQIERQGKGIASILGLSDVQVLVAINGQGVYIIDPAECTVLLGLKYEEMSWDFAKPSQEKNPNCLPCLFLQFVVTENSLRVSKILQIFSKQAIMMDALISSFVNDIRQRAVVVFSDEVDGQVYDTSTDVDDVLVPLTTVSRREVPHSTLCNKLERLSLATFDDDGRCVHQMGSWSFSQ